MAIKLCVLFGGVSPEHEVSLRSAEAILGRLDPRTYDIYPVGITRRGKWIYFAKTDWSMLPADTWESAPGNCPAAISPARGQGLLLWRETGVEEIPLDCVFPVLHGENGEDGSIQGLMQVAGIPCVGPGVAASAACMDKTLTKLMVGEAGIRQANWYLARRERMENNLDALVRDIVRGGDFPLFVKPSGTGSSVGVSKVRNEEELRAALIKAAEFDSKVLVEEFVDGRELEVAVLGNGDPVASVVGEIIAGAEFYDYDAKYNSQESRTLIPADIPESAARELRETAVDVYRTMGCRGLSRVDFFLTHEGNKVVFNEINTLPGFTSISMYPKLFEATGVPYGKLLEELIRLAMEG